MSPGVLGTQGPVEYAVHELVLSNKSLSDHAAREKLFLLLAQLASAHLPFTLPVPVRTRAGETFAQVVVGGATVLASLTPLLPGTHPDPDHMQHARRLGETLGHLGQALADVTPPPGRRAAWENAGSPRMWHHLWFRCIQPPARLPTSSSPK